MTDTAAPVAPAISRNESEFVWYQRYRPQTLAETVLPEEFKNALRSYVTDGRIPSMLFYSPSPGTGKTTTALALCREMGIRPLFINASKDNDIETIRTRVVDYATTKSVINPHGFKVVVLDEGERLSTASQEALKGIIEQVSKQCSFIITTNAKGRIIEPLRSRCELVEFIYSTEQMTEINALMAHRAIQVLQAENVPFDLEPLVELVRDCAPDNRAVLVKLQSMARRYGKIDQGALQRLNEGTVEDIVEAIKGKDFKSAKEWCMNYNERVGVDFYTPLYLGLEPLLVAQSIPMVVLAINDFMRHHEAVPDKFVHLLALCTTLMMEARFK